MLKKSLTTRVENRLYWRRQLFSAIPTCRKNFEILKLHIISEMAHQITPGGGGRHCLLQRRLVKSVWRRRRSRRRRQETWDENETSLIPCREVGVVVNKVWAERESTYFEWVKGSGQRSGEGNSEQELGRVYQLEASEASVLSFYWGDEQNLEYSAYIL